MREKRRILIKKETLLEVFSCQFHDFLSIFFYRTPPVAASDIIMSKIIFFPKNTDLSFSVDNDQTSLLIG